MLHGDRDRHSNGDGDMTKTATSRNLKVDLAIETSQLPMYPNGDVSRTRNGNYLKFPCNIGEPPAEGQRCIHCDVFRVQGILNGFFLVGYSKHILVLSSVYPFT